MHKYVFDIDKKTIKNNYFRTVIYTDNFQQLVLMSLNPGEFIELEKHNGAQFLKIEQGNALITIIDKNIKIKDISTLMIPPNTCHKIQNMSKTKTLKLYTIYRSPECNPDTAEKTKK